MKRVNFLKNSFLAILLVSTGVLSAQDVTADFGWVSVTASNVSGTQIQGCDGNGIDVRLTTSPLTHQLNGSTAAKIPSTTSSTGNTLVTLNFSPAVYDLSLLIADFDEAGGESGTGFTPAFSSISPFGGSPVFVGNLAGTAVTPNGQANTVGWVNWTGAISSISFTYNRDPNWLITLEEMTFNCGPTLTCACSPKTKFNTIGLVSSNGQTTSELQINSGGVAISTLNISIPFWKSLVDASCIDGCNKKALLNSGNILNTLPTIAGVTPTFAGTGGLSSEIVYQFPTPTVINEAIKLKMQFPPTLPLSCCTNKVEYCVKVQMITEKCEVCEITLCSSGTLTGSPKIAGKLKVSENIDGGGGQKSLIISPNPASDFINVKLPKAQGTIFIYTVNGNLVYEENVTEKRMTIGTQQLESGNYIVKYKNEQEELTAKFVIN